MKTWTKVKHEENEAEQRNIETLVSAQSKALEELRLESEELYQAAVRCDPGLFPLENRGPYNTAPIAKYNPPDGKYSDTTKVYIQQQ